MGADLSNEHETALLFLSLIIRLFQENELHAKDAKDPEEINKALCHSLSVGLTHAQEINPKTYELIIRKIFCNPTSLLLDFACTIFCRLVDYRHD